MEKKEYLTEENYNKVKNKLTKIALILLIVGLGIGGFLIYNGVKNPSSKSLDELASVLETKKNELEDKGIKYDTFAKYTDGESYELKVITNALDPSFSYCSFDEYKNNDITKEYCSVKNKNSDISKKSSIMFGVFICFSTCSIAGVIYVFSKRREITAFTTQQVMPVAKEGVETMAPTIGNLAKEITKGIKEGMNDDEK